MDKSQLSKNIKALRIAYGETQEELGLALHVEKSAISNYETGARVPDKNMLAMIARHFSISVQEILYSDLSNVAKILIDPTAFYRYIDDIFPIVSSEESLKSNTFSEAYKHHCRMYDKFHTAINNIGSALDFFDDFIELYIDCIENEEAKLESEVNVLALIFFLWYLSKVLAKSPEYITNTPAGLLQIASSNSILKKHLNNPDAANDTRELSNEAYEFLIFFEDPEMKEWVDNIFIDLKHSTYADVADYYLALQYVFGFVDNGLNDEFNQRIGAEMMSAFARVNNPYVERYFHYLVKGCYSSQSVDDK